MCTETAEQKNACLDQILARRRSYRMFRPEFPSEDAIRRIIQAGLLAPFAAAAVGNSTDYFRRFFVMKKGSASMIAASPLVMEQVTIMAQGLETGDGEKPGTSHYGSFLCPASHGNPEDGQGTGHRDCSLLYRRR